MLHLCMMTWSGRMQCTSASRADARYIAPLGDANHGPGDGCNDVLKALAYRWHGRAHSVLECPAARVYMSSLLSILQVRSAVLQ
ncbi:hypothetical protein XF_0756 [Xylella fastidiosa 9a5c]|uniref:Uncharacterized protein n=1 Tax=Xylella fastidiosa (strain 9a5c) TaxID=160492 RepID=Q9PFC2_XYLFA|nr:hypothetical protein XF_0756 [Xylella fastidiosa 9a5c]